MATAEARRGTNPVLVTGSGGRARVRRRQVPARMEARKGPEKRQGEMAVTVADKSSSSKKLRCTEGAVLDAPAHI